MRLSGLREASRLPIIVLVVLAAAAVACSSDDADATPSDLLPSAEELGNGWEAGRPVRDAPQPYEMTVLRCSADGLSVGEPAGVGMFFNRRYPDGSSAGLTSVALEADSVDDARELAAVVETEEFTRCLDDAAQEDPVNGVFFGGLRYIRAQVVAVREIDTDLAEDVSSASYIQLAFEVTEEDGRPASAILQGLVVIRGERLVQISRLGGLHEQTEVDHVIEVLVAQFRE